MAINSIKRNYIYNVLVQIFSLIVPFITTPYVSRVLMADGIGYYSYTNSIATYFSLFAALGVSAYGLREVSMTRNDKKVYTKTFWELFIIKLFMTGLSLSVYLLLVVINGENPHIYLATGVVIVTVAFDFTWFLQAMEDFKTLMFRNLIIKSASVLLIFTLVRSKDDLVLYILIHTLSDLFANACMIPRVKKYLGKVKLTELNPLKHLRQTIVYFIPTIATSVYTVLDITMLGFLVRTPIENGFYDRGQKIINMLLTVTTSMNVIVGVRTSYLFGQGKDHKIKEYINKTFRFMSLVSMPMIFGLLACARNFVSHFLGAGYEKVGPVLFLFSPLIYIIGVSNILGSTYLTPSGQRARSNKAIITGAIINFCLNLVLIPTLKSYGAVISTLAAEGAISLMYIKMSSDYIKFSDVFKATIKYTVLGAIMFVPVYLIGLKWHTLTALIVQILVGFLFYVLLLLITKDRIIFEELDIIFSKFDIDIKPEDSEVIESQSSYAVSDQMKKVWQVEIDLLKRVIDICDKHNIVYYVSGGTLLGAIRHKGFIPWDNDIDVVMMRSEYDRFLKVAKDELEAPYFLQTADTDEGYFRGHAQIRNSSTTGMLIYEGPRVKFNQGIFIDIFPLDNIPDDEGDEQFQRNQLKLINRMLSLGAQYNPDAPRKLIMKLLRPLVIFASAFYPFKKQYDTMQRLCTAYNDKDTKRVGFLSFDAENERLKFTRKSFENPVLMPFEDIMVNVPGGYDEQLTHQYGDYMVMKREKNYHGLVVFDIETPYAEFIENYKRSMNFKSR